MTKEDFENIKVGAYLKELESRFGTEMMVAQAFCFGMNKSIYTFTTDIQKIKLSLDNAEVFYNEWKRVKVENNLA